MKIATIIARLLLGLIFFVFGLNFFLHFIPMPKEMPGGAVGAFFTATYTTGYMAAIKVFEILGGLLLLTGKYVPLGLTLLGPVIINILFYDFFLSHAFNPVSTLAAVLALFLLYVHRSAFAALVRP